MNIPNAQDLCKETVKSDLKLLNLVLNIPVTKQNRRFMTSNVVKLLIFPELSIEYKSPITADTINDKYLLPT